MRLAQRLVTWYNFFFKLVQEGGPIITYLLAYRTAYFSYLTLISYLTLFLLYSPLPFYWDKINPKFFSLSSLRTTIFQVPFPFWLRKIPPASYKVNTLAIGVETVSTNASFGNSVCWFRGWTSVLKHEWILNCTNRHEVPRQRELKLHRSNLNSSASVGFRIYSKLRVTD